MLYTKDSYPSIMEPLPEEVRQKAIQFTNEMLIDGDVRYHKDFIILKAIQKALLSVSHQSGEGAKPEA